MMQSRAAFNLPGSGQALVHEDALIGSAGPEIIGVVDLVGDHFAGDEALDLAIRKLMLFPGIGLRSE